MVKLAPPQVRMHHFKHIVWRHKSQSSFWLVAITGAIFPFLAAAQSIGTNQFVPLIPDLPLLTGQYTVTGLLNAAFGITIGVAAVLAVIMIAVGGFRLMATESPFSIGDAKEQIQQAILGLLIILVSVLVLNTINPEITRLNPFRNANLTSAPLNTNPGGGTGTYVQLPAVNGECPSQPGLIFLAKSTDVNGQPICLYVSNPLGGTPGQPGTPTAPTTGDPTTPTTPPPFGTGGGF